MPWILKRPSDKRHLQLTQPAGHQELQIPAAFQTAGSLPSLPGHGHALGCTEVSALCLCHRQDPRGTLLLLGLFWEGEKGKANPKTNAQTNRKRRWKHAHRSPFMNNSHGTLQPNAANTHFTHTNKRVASCCVRNDCYSTGAAKVTTKQESS